MGIIIRQSLKTTIVTYAGVVLGYVSVLLLQPLCLKPEEIGLFRVILDAAIVFSFFAQLGIPNIAVKFFPDFAQLNDRKNGFFLFLLAAPLLGIIFFSIVFVLGKEWIVQYYRQNSALFVEYMYYVLPIGFITVYYNVLESYSRVKLRIAVPGLIKEVLYRVMFISLILLYYFQVFNLHKMVNGFVVINVISLSFLIAYIFKQGWLDLASNFSYLKKFIPSMANFGAYSIIGGMTGIIFFKLDVLMLSSMDSLAQTGIYTIAFFAATVIEIPKRAINLIAAPIVSDALKREDIAKIDELYWKSSINQGVFSFLLLVLLWVNIDDLFSLMPNSEIYVAGKYVVLLVAIGKMMDIMTGINDAIMINSKYYRVNVYFMFVLLPTAFILNYLFIPPWGIIGAALGTAISIFLYNLAKLIFIWIKFKIQPFNNSTTKLLIISGLTYAVGVFFPDFDIPIVDIAVKSIVLAVLFSSAVYYFRISEDLNNLVREGIRKYF